MNFDDLDYVWTYIISMLFMGALVAGGVSNGVALSAHAVITVFILIAFLAKGDEGEYHG